MYNDLITTYQEIMTDLRQLPNTIADNQAEVTELKLQINAVERDMAAQEPDLMNQVDGKNADERKASLARLKQTDPTYSRYIQRLAQLQNDLVIQQDRLDHATRCYSAAMHRARLHAAMMQLIAAGGESVPQDVDFRKSSPSNSDATNGVTSSDAAAIGL